MTEIIHFALKSLAKLRGKASLILKTNNAPVPFSTEKCEKTSHEINNCTCFLCSKHPTEYTDTNFNTIYSNHWPEYQMTNEDKAEFSRDLDETLIMSHNVFINSIKNEGWNLVKNPPSGAPEVIEITEDEAFVGIEQYLDLKMERKTNIPNPLEKMNWEGIYEPGRKSAETLVKDFANKLLSFDDADFSVIKTWALDLELVSEDPFQVKPFAQGFEIETEMKKMLAKQEMAGIIARASRGSYLSPCFLVLKNSEQKRLPPGVPKKFRMIIDYRVLNERLKHNSDKFSVYGTAELIYRIGQMRRQMAGPISSILFTTMDIKSYFYSICLTPQSRTFLAFRGYGTQVYEPQVLPMGVSLAPAISSEILLKAI